MSGTTHLPVVESVTVVKYCAPHGRCRTLYCSSTLYRCSQCLLYFYDARDFVAHLDDGGECKGAGG